MAINYPKTLNKAYYSEDDDAQYKTRHYVDAPAPAPVETSLVISQEMLLKNIEYLLESVNLLEDKLAHVLSSPEPMEKPFDEDAINTKLDPRSNAVKMCSIANNKVNYIASRVNSINIRFEN